MNENISQKSFINFLMSSPKEEVTMNIIYLNDFDNVAKIIVRRMIQRGYWDKNNLNKFQIEIFANELIHLAKKRSEFDYQLLRTLNVYLRVGEDTAVN